MSEADSVRRLLVTVPESDTYRLARFHARVGHVANHIESRYRNERVTAAYTVMREDAPIVLDAARRIADLVVQEIDIVDDAETYPYLVGEAGGWEREAGL